MAKAIKGIFCREERSQTIYPQQLEKTLAGPHYHNLENREGCQLHPEATKIPMETISQTL